MINLRSAMYDPDWSSRSLLPSSRLAHKFANPTDATSSGNGSVTARLELQVTVGGEDQRQGNWEPTRIHLEQELGWIR